MDYEKIGKHIMVFCCIVLSVSVGWYLLREQDIHDQRERAGDVREELGNSGDAQRDAAKHIDDAGRRIERSVDAVDAIAGRIDESADRIESVQERSGYVAGILEDSERRIEESQRIIQSVRSRAR